MAEHTVTRAERDRDNGFTLIEMLIVVVTIGVIATAVSAVIVVTLRTSPAAEVRVDDARSVQGLVTWLPQDIDAAPPGGFNRDTGYWPCSGSAPANSHNVLTAEWTERTGADHDFAATYRYELNGTDWTMVRYVCDNGGSGPMGTSTRVNLTSALPPWNNFAPPATVEMCSSSVSAGGVCPTGDIIPASDTSPSEVLSMKMKITRFDGVVATIDAAPKNPDQDLSDDPNASSNAPPTVSQTNFVLQMHAGQTVTIDLGATHNATDPDGDTISAALDSTEPIPTGISAVTADPLDLTVTADPTLPNGVLSPHIVVIVSDNNAGWVDATVTVEIIPQVNIPPQVSPVNYLLQMEAGQTVTIPLDVTNGVFDPNGDPLIATVLSHPSSFVTPPKVNEPGPLDLQVKTPGGATLGLVAAPIAIEISDGNGGTALATVTIEIIPAAVNNPPTASPANISVDMNPGQTYSFNLAASHNVTDPDADPVSVVSSTDPAGAASTLDGGVNGLDVTITPDAGLPAGPLAGLVSFTVEDIHGAAVTVSVSINIVIPLPPPSDCVLVDLEANPDTVDRQGGGGQAHLLKEDVIVTITYTGSCDGLALFYDSGDTSGLGIGTGRIFTGPSPASIVIVGKPNGGTEKWSPGVHVLTATTTSNIAANTITETLEVT